MVSPTIFAMSMSTLVDPCGDHYPDHVPRDVKGHKASSQSRGEFRSYLVGRAVDDDVHVIRGPSQQVVANGAAHQVCVGFHEP